MSFEAGFALGDSFGPEVFLGGADLGDALAEAAVVYPKHTSVLFDGDLYTVEREGGDRFEPNLTRKGMAAMAHKRSGLGTYGIDQVMSMSVAEAHRLLEPFFRIRIRSGAHKGKIVVAYETAAKMRRKFLTANAKLMKGVKSKIAGVAPGISRGPNLLPHALVGELSRKRKLGLVPKDRVDFCVGSNEACRSTCLIYAGNNPVADKQVNIKLARSEALLREPVAWLRMFMAAIEYHLEYSAKRDLVPYVRPNVLSDIPWERVFPGMFELFPDLSFYDYTKVAGREIKAPNYDMTFSFSGTNSGQVESELRRGLRIAVVFWLPKPCSRHPKPPCDSPADLTFLGQQVIDGDHHDFRPLDPPGSVIGLSYKVPLVKGQRYTKPPPGADKFVIPTFRDTDTGALIVAGTPAQLGAAEVFEDSSPTTVEVT